MDCGKINKCKMTTMMSHTEKKFLFDCGVADWTDTWNDIFPTEIHNIIWKNRYADCIEDLNVEKRAWEETKERHRRYNPNHPLDTYLEERHERDYNMGRGCMGISYQVQHDLNSDKRTNPIKWEGKTTAKVHNILNVKEPFLHDFAEQLKKIELPGWVFKEARNKRHNYSSAEDKTKENTWKELYHHIGATDGGKYINMLHLSGVGRGWIETKQGERFRFMGMKQEGQRWKSDAYRNEVVCYWEHINSGYCYRIRYDFDWSESSKTSPMKKYGAAFCWVKYPTEHIKGRFRLDKQEINILAGRVVFPEVEQDFVYD
jgi:hypothetical protein